MSDFVLELTKFPKSIPIPPNSPKWDLENCARYAQNFITLLGIGVAEQEYDVRI